MSDKILDRYRRLVELSRDVASTLELDALLNRIVTAAKEISESEAASILLYEENLKQLFFQASTNLDSPMMGGLRVPLDSIAGWIISNKKPLVIQDVSQDPRFFGGVAKATNFVSRSILGVPLITKNKTVGVLEAINKLEGEFTEEDQEMLMVLGAQAAVAIENTRLFLQSDLISEMVHELRTPLGSINSATYLLLRPEITQEQYQKMVTIIQGEARRLSEMTTSFLDLSRLESGRVQFIPEEINLTNLLVECANITFSSMVERQLNFVWEPPKNLPHIVGDKDKLKQVFLNLLSNAVKYNSPKGTLTLKAGTRDGRVYISVSDTGPGIPKESLGNLFKKFYRVPGTEKLAQGTGLGLSIVKKIVEAHQGEIKVKSKIGEGTTFTVSLPFRREKIKAEPAL
ncbi:MAG: hypothetical protein Fur0022_23280 [Anaerolineales bacterium]